MVLSTIEWVILAALFGLFFAITIVVTFVILYRLKWNFKYVVLENTAGQGYSITRRGRARAVAFGDGGEEIFFLKGIKKWRVGYGKRIGKNQIGWAVGQDGYWYNFTFGDLDAKLFELGVTPVDRDMRYAYASVRKGLENRYDKKNFLEKYGVYMAFGMLFLCIIAFGGFVYIGLNKQAQVAAINNQGYETSLKVMELAKEVLSDVDNIKQNGKVILSTPIVPVTNSTI